MDATLELLGVMWLIAAGLFILSFVYAHIKLYKK